jgi:hypothetical protein
MTWSQHYSYWVNATELEQGEIFSLLRRDVVSMDLWERETNRWTHYPYQMTPEEVITDHDKQVSEKIIRLLAQTAFVPPKLNPQRLKYNENGDAFITKGQFDGHLRHPIVHSLLPEQIFWDLASRNGVLPQTLFYFYLEQEGHGWVLDPNHNSYRNQGPEYCCRSNSRTICSKTEPLNLLKKKLVDLDYDKRRVSLGELLQSLDPFPCLLLDYEKFIYFVFKLTEEKFVILSKDNDGQKFLQKSFYEVPRRGRKPNHLK